MWCWGTNLFSKAACVVIYNPKTQKRKREDNKGRRLFVARRLLPSSYRNICYARVSAANESTLTRIARLKAIIESRKMVLNVFFGTWI